MEDHKLQQLLKACRKQKRTGQQALYREFYGFAYAITRRYAKGAPDASVILNKGFYAAFSDVKGFRNQPCFTQWLRQRLVRAAADHYFPSGLTVSLQQTAENVFSPAAMPLPQLSYATLLSLVQGLGDAERVVYNLVVMDGFDQQSAGKLLTIPTCAVEVLLARARSVLWAKLNL